MVSPYFHKQLALGKKVEEIKIRFHLTEMKPIHAKCVTQFYNHMSKEDSSKAIINGWERSYIFEVVTDGSSVLSSIDSFQDIN